MPARTKTFDAVEMSRELRARTSRRLAVMSREDRLKLLNGHIQKIERSQRAEGSILREDPPVYRAGRP